MKRLLSLIVSICLTMSMLAVGAFADFSADVNPIQETSVFSSSADESSFGNISANDKAVLVPEESFEYVDFAAKIDETAEFENDSVIVSMKRGVENVNRVYTAEDFPELDVAYIEDLTYLTNQDLLDDPEFMANYTQILQIHLNSSSKAKLIESVDALSARSTVDIASVTPNYEFEIEGEPCSYDNTLDPTEEPLYSSKQKQYTDRINLEGAWELAREIESDRGLTTVKVAVIDSGVANGHDDLENVVITGYDAYNENTITNDVLYHNGDSYKYDHGTAVAGIIGAETNEQFLAGIALNVEIVPIQFYGEVQENNLGNGKYSYTFSINSGIFTRVITYLNNNNIPIANYSNSFGFTNSSVINTLTTVINNYFGLFIASAGNTTTRIDPSTIGNLATYNCNNIISVMGTAVNSDGEEMAYVSTSTDTSGNIIGSNYGKECIDIAAPWDAYTTMYNWSTGVYTHGYFSGTSASAPYVAGVAALVKSVRPELSSNDIKNILLHEESSKSSLKDVCINGCFLDAEAAVQMAINYDILEPQTFMEDVNDDGYDDLVYLREYNGKRHLQVFLGSNSNHLGTPATYPSTSDTTRCSVDTLTSDEFKSTDVAFMGDVNGDGRMDMIVHSSTSNKNRKFYVYLGQSNGKFSSAVTSTMSNMHDTNVYPCKLFIGKFNSDSYCDFLVHYRSADGKRTNLVYTGKSTGGFNVGITTSTTNSYVESDPVFVMDVTGDGCDDVVVHWSMSGYRQLLVYISAGGGSFLQNAENTNTNNRHSLTEFPCEFLTGDFNGDNKDDFLVYWKNASSNGQIIVYPGTSSGEFGTDVASSVSGAVYNDTIRLFSADTNNDTYDDIIIHWVTSANKGSLAVLKSNGNSTFTTKYQTDTSYQISGENIKYRVYIGDVNGWGIDFVTEVTDPDNAYRSRVLVNLGTSSGFQSYTYMYKLRTFFYIDM